MLELRKEVSMGIKEIAKEAGVSVATVSRVLNGTKFVSEDLKQQVLACIEKERVRSDHVARSMVLKKTFSNGLIIPEVSELYHQMVFHKLNTAGRGGLQGIGLPSQGHGIQRPCLFGPPAENRWTACC
jgi:predicted transcriptional regulator